MGCLLQLYVLPRMCSDTDFCCGHFQELVAVPALPAVTSGSVYLQSLTHGHLHCGWLSLRC